MLDAIATAESLQDVNLEPKDYLPQELLVKYRKLGGWTQQQLAEQIGLTSSRTIRKWELGENFPKAPTLKLLIELYVKQQIFQKDLLEPEIRTFWTVIKQTADNASNKSNLYPEFDEKWFRQVLQKDSPETASDKTNSAHKITDPQNSLTTATQSNPPYASSTFAAKATQTPLLTTKLFIPTLRSNLVQREQLVALVQKGLQGKLTLISAPAGFGKTTLACEWFYATRANSNSQKVAWISLDENDNDPVRFVRYIVYAFQRANLQIDVRSLEQLYLLRPLPLEDILTEFINQLNTNFFASETNPQTQPMSIVLVLDDYHIIENDAVHQLISFLLEHSPENLHLLLTSRIDPPIPLHRLRVRGQLMEVRIQDLRFNHAEITTFMEKFGDFSLTDHQLSQLEQTTEGWVASLQLAALALQGNSDHANFINSFSGNHFPVLDYLIKEVLDHQTEKVRHFLLTTAALERFNASLASAVTNSEWSSADLLQLQKANLFLVSLDNVGEWYRYHHLFSDVLRHQLQTQQPKLLPELQLKASLWFEQNDLVYEAILCALNAQAYEQASRLIANFYGDALSRSNFDLLGKWLNQIPVSNLAKYPELCYNAFLFAFYNGKLGNREKQIIEKLESYINNENKPEWLGKLFMLRSLLARYYFDWDNLVINTEQALLYLPADALFERNRLNTSLLAGYLNQGEINKSLSVLLRLQKNLNPINNLENEVSLVLAFGGIYVRQGKLKQAAQFFKQFIELAEGTWVNPLFAYIELAHIYWEWNRPDEARQYLQKVEELATAGGWRIGQFVIPNLWTDNNNFFPQLHKANQDKLASSNLFAMQGEMIVNQQIRELRYRLNGNIEQQNLEEIDDTEIYFTINTITNNHSLTYQREPIYLKFAEKLAQQAQFSQAFELLEGLRQVATAQGRTHYLIKILTLQTRILATGTNPDFDRALATLTEALTLAESGGYLRIFFQEGAYLEKMLHSKVFQSGKLAFYVKQILKAFESQNSTKNYFNPPSQTFNIALAETLTQRELTILRMMSMGASNQEIADELVLAIGTVKKHLTNIFGKLAVTNRTQALIRAQELGLV